MDLLCPASTLDSPGVPVSAASKEVFKGFSYVAPMLYEVSLHPNVMTSSCMCTLVIGHISCDEIMMSFLLIAVCCVNYLDRK